MPFIYETSLANYSISYDGITIYSNVPYKLNNPVMILNSVLPPFDYERNIFTTCADHSLYHQDKFNRTDTHWHIKIRSLVSDGLIKVMLEKILASGKMSPAEHVDFQAKWLKRHDAAIEKLSILLTHDKSADYDILRHYLQSIDDVSTLVALHKHLQKSQFDYLRARTGATKISFWRGSVDDLHIKPTSRTWAMIEKMFELQMALSIALKADNPVQVASEKAQQLKNNHLFFAAKRTYAPGRHDHNATYRTFKKGNIHELHGLHSNHFAKMR